MIFFDIDGTLLDHKSAERTAALSFQRDHANVFPEPSEAFAERWHSVAEKHVRRYLAGDISFQGQRRARLQELFSHSCSLPDADADELFDGYLRRYEESWVLYPDVRPCLAKFKGHQLGVISNGDAKQQRQKLAALGVLCFSTIVISGDIGIAKPAEGIFAAACRAAGRKRNECVYVGDDLHSDAEGSLQAGLHAVWLNRDGSTVPSGFTALGSLACLDEVIESHNNDVHSIRASRAAASM